MKFRKSIRYLVIPTILAGLAGCNNNRTTDGPVAPIVEENIAPIAAAGADQTVYEKQLVMLQGGGIDNNGDDLSYTWSQLTGPTVNLIDANQINASFIAPRVTMEQAVTQISLRLTVSDSEFSHSDDVLVTVEATQLFAGDTKLVADSSELALNTSALTSADLNGDGDLDLISGENGALKWYPNQNRQAFQSAQLLYDSHEEILAVTGADIDDDGDVDIVVNFAYRVGWLENLSHDGFASVQVLDEQNINSFESNLAVTDIDGDGLKDILTFHHQQLSWHKQSIDGGFEPKQALIDQRFEDSVIIDFDGDGDLDVLSIHRDDPNVKWLQNLGNGQFSKHSVVELDEVDPTALEVVDMDHNGAMDIMISDGSSLTVFINSAQGGFTRRQLVDSLGGSVDRLVAADFDGDNDTDIVFSSTYTEDNGIWLNSGNNVTGTIDRAWGGGQRTPVLHQGDFFAQSQPELAFSTLNMEKLSIASFVDDIEVTDITASFADSGLAHLNGVRITDMNNDGRMDIVARTHQAGKLMLFNGTGLGSFESQKVLSFNQLNFTGMVIADFSQDGLPDILTTAIPTWGSSQTDFLFTTFENQGNNQFNSIGIMPVGQSEWIWEMTEGDIDGDGDLDVLGAGRYGGHQTRLAWYENLGMNSFVEHIILNDWGDTSNHHVSDLDNDGDGDILFTTYRGGEYTLYSINNKGQAGWVMQGPHAKHSELSYNFHVADIDGDGFTDIVAQMNGAPHLLANEGNGEFEDPSRILPIGRVLSVVDFDLDNSLDLLVRVGVQTQLFEKGTDGAFLMTERFNSPQDGYYNYGDVTVGDLDSDGDPDLLFGSWVGNWLGWIENQL